MKSVLLILFIFQISISQTDILHDKFVKRINTLIDSTDAVVGLAIKDINTGETIVINGTEIFTQASTIKIHILSEVFKQASEKKFNLSDIRPLPFSAHAAGSGILNMLGEKTVSLCIRDYCVLMMVLSDNSATNFLIDLVGMKNVNESLIKNGVQNTKLHRIMMDIQAAQEGRENIGTPTDILIILEKLLRGEIVSKNASREMLEIMRLDKDGWLKNGLPPGILIANKAGDIDGVKNDVGIVYLENHPYIICVMTKMLMKDSDGINLITSISRETYNYFERKANFNQFGRRIP